MAQAPPLAKPPHFTNAEPLPHRELMAVEGLGLGLSHGHSAISVWISLPLDAFLNKHCSSLLDFLLDPCFSTWSHTSSVPLHVFRTQGWLHNVWAQQGQGKSISPFFGPGARASWAPR